MVSLESFFFLNSIVPGKWLFFFFLNELNWVDDEDKDKDDLVYCPGFNEYDLE